MEFRGRSTRASAKAAQVATLVAHQSRTKPERRASNEGPKVRDSRSRGSGTVGRPNTCTAARPRARQCPCLPPAVRLSMLLPPTAICAMYRDRRVRERADALLGFALPEGWLSQRTFHDEIDTDCRLVEVTPVVGRAAPCEHSRGPAPGLLPRNGNGKGGGGRGTRGR